ALRHAHHACFATPRVSCPRWWLWTTLALACASTSKSRSARYPRHTVRLDRHHDGLVREEDRIQIQHQYPPLTDLGRKAQDQLAHLLDAAHPHFPRGYQSRYHPRAVAARASASGRGTATPGATTGRPRIAPELMLLHARRRRHHRKNAVTLCY